MSLKEFAISTKNILTFDILSLFIYRLASLYLQTTWHLLTFLHLGTWVRDFTNAFEFQKGILLSLSEGSFNFS